VRPLPFLLLLLPLLVAACASSAAAQLAAGNPTPAGNVVRIYTAEGTGEELVSTADSPRITQTKLTPPVGGGTRLPTFTATPTATITPTVTPSPRATSTATVTPTLTPTPRGGPDLNRMVAQFQKLQRYRSTLMGPADLMQEVVPERYRVYVNGPQPAELIVQGMDVFLRKGSYWRRLENPPAELVARLDRGVPALRQMAALKHQFALKGTVRTRAGRCLDWDVVDALPKEPISICQGVFDDLPYRVQLGGGAIIEFFDFDQPIAVPVPEPQID
jgi:hypothetical protein